MKKTIITAFILLISTFCFSQSKFTWGSHPCYSQIQVGTQNWGYSKDAGGYLWGVAIKNTSSRTLQVSYRFSVGGEAYAGGGYQVTSYLAPGKIWSEGESRFTALLFKSNSINYNFEVKDLCYDGEDCFKIGFIDCDGKRYGGRNTNSNSESNGNSGNSNNNTGGKTAKSLFDELNSLCAEAYAINSSNTQSTAKAYCDEKTYNDSDESMRSMEQRIKLLKEAIEKGKTDSKENDAKAEAAQKAADEKAERERKAAEEKNNRYQTYMSDGESALSNEKYDEALQNFQNAVNEASNDGQLNAARNAYAKAQTAKEAALRKVRVEEKQAVEKKQNDVTTAAIGGFAGVMALVKDNYSNGKFAAKFQIGLGYGNNPLIVNSVKQFKTTIKDNNQILFHLGFNLTVFNKKGINFELKPSLGIGLASYQKGTDGGGEEYGGTGILWLAPKAKSNFKLFAEGGYFFRNGTYNYDQDVALGPTSATDNVEKGEFKYKVLKYGGGFKISFVNDEYLESYIKPAMFLEMPSFFTKTTKPTMVFNVQAYVLSNALIDFSYSKNYYIPGKIDYFGSFTKENKNYFSIKIIRQGKLK